MRGNIQTSPDLEFYGRVDLRFPLQWATFYMSFVRCVEDILELSQIGGEAYLLTVKFPYSQVPHLLQFQIRLQYLLPNIDSGYNISYHFLFYKAERNHNGSKP